MAVVSSIVYSAILIGVTAFVTMITDTNPLVSLCVFIFGILFVIGVALTAASDGEEKTTRANAEPVKGIFVNTQSREEIKELESGQSCAITVVRH